MVQLEKNLIDLKPESLRHCIHVFQLREEIWPRVNEGPFVIKRNGVYFMTYSANIYESPFYGIEITTATNIKGPWTKYANNSIFQKPGNLSGVGHSTLFTDKEGKIRIVFYAYNSATQIHPRNMYISTVSFETKYGKDVITIDKNYMTPIQKKQ